MLFYNLSKCKDANTHSTNAPTFKVECDHYQTEGFDPGSERTLAAWIRYASRTGTLQLILRVKLLRKRGERVSN